MITKKIKGLKFENIDLFAAMGNIVDSHVQHYKTDFDIDKSMLRKAAEKESREERTYIWLCRSMGTWLLNERNVFIQDTREYNTFKFYAEQTSDCIHAYVVEVTGMDGDTVVGSLYTLNYRSHYTHVMELAQKTRSVLFVYENGQIEKPAYSYLCACDDKVYGEFKYTQFQPEDNNKLNYVLAEERRIRDSFKNVNFMQYILSI